MKKRFAGQRTLSDLIQKPLKPIQKKRGFAESRILNDWVQIVGPLLAQHSVPQKLHFPKGQQGATLTIRCESGWAVELQYQQDVICDKIAAYFGYRAVESIRIQQGPLPKTAAAPTKESAPPTVEEDKAMDAMLNDIEDDELKSALKRFGLSRNPSPALEKEESLDDI